MFVGEHNRSVDGAGRLALPADMRKQLGEHCYITRDPAGCLTLRDEPAFEAEFEAMMAKIESGELRPDAARAFGSRTERAKIDSNGRITIEQKLRSYANISGEATLIGVIRKLEIWRPSRYEMVGPELDDASDTRFWGDEDDD